MCIGCVTLLLCIAINARSVSAQWQLAYDVKSGDIESLASDATFIYAGTDSGVFRSSDEGGTWLQVNQGLLNLEVYTLGISKKGNLFGGTEGHGIFRTSNAGNLWAEKIKGLPDSSTIFSIVGDQRGNVYAGSSTDGVFFSSDEGDNWTYRSAGLRNTFVFSMIVTPVNELIVGLSGEIARSVDSGMHWTQLDSLAPNNEVLALACDSASVLFAGTLTGNILRSSDNGAHWTTAASSPTRKPVRSIAVHGSIVFAATYGDGVLESFDRGIHWQSVNGGLTDTLLYRITISPKGYVYLGTYTAKIFRSPTPLAVKSDQQPAPQMVGYPNPATSSITFSQIGSHVDRVRVYDMLGRERYVALQEESIDLKLLESGVYIARIVMHERVNGHLSDTKLLFLVTH
jgi:photosystem II stability/assembly factor-like uncharacterized protein